MISTIVRRPSDGHPNRECPSDCDVDCHFNNATLDRVMNYPLRRVQIESFIKPAEPKTNHPWGWINGAGFWLVCILMGLAYGIGYGIVSLAKRLSF